MKILVAIMILAAALSAGAQMYSNSITGELASALPNPLWLNGWKSPPSSEDYAAAGWAALTAEQIAALQQAAQEYAAQLAVLVGRIGPIVRRVNARLLEIDPLYGLPNDSTALMETIVARSEAGTLTDDQRTAQLLLTDMFLILRGQGVTDEQINAVWEAVRP